MRIRALVSTLVMTLSVVSVGALVGGCGDSKPAAKAASIKAGEMPAGGSWTGVFYSPLFGNLHLIAQGDKVQGKWQRPRKGQWGELKGELDGDVLRFSYSEYVDGLVGPNSKRSGHGYFKYSRPPGENVDDRLEGEIGRGDDEVGIPWNAIKQRNVKPDLASIGGADTSDIGGGDWDSPNTEKGDPEPPVEPKDPLDDEDAPDLD